MEAREGAFECKPINSSREAVMKMNNLMRISVDRSPRYLFGIIGSYCEVKE